MRHTRPVLRDRITEGQTSFRERQHCATVSAAATSTTTRTTSSSTSIPTRCFARLREEAPLYYNDQHDFYALSRFDDVNAALIDHETFISGRGAMLELIKSGMEIPPGTSDFRGSADPQHPPQSAVADVHAAQGASRWSRRSASSPPGCLDPLVGTGRFDFVNDLGAQMPMRVIGDAARHPGEDQEPSGITPTRSAHRGRPADGEHADDHRHRRGVRRVHRLARRASVRRHHDRPAQRRVRGRDRHRAPVDAATNCSST